MNWLFKLNNFFRIWGATFRAMARFKIWLPLILLLLLQVILLFVLTRFYQSPFSLVLVPLLKALVGEKALHYPGFYVALPFAYNLLNLVVVGFLSILINATAILLLSFHFWGRPIDLKEALSGSRSRFGHLFLLWLVNTIAVGLVLILPGFILSGWMGGSPRRILFVQLASYGLGVLVAALFAYCYNAILLSGETWLKSIRTNWGIFRRNFFSTCFFIAIPGFVSWLYGVLISNSPLIMSKFRPDIIPLLLIFGSVINLLVIFWILGSLARLFLQEVKEVQL